MTLRLLPLLALGLLLALFTRNIYRILKHYWDIDQILRAVAEGVLDAFVPPAFRPDFV